ncbi:MAG: hypothetical protein OEX12_06130 [Gammaproteobacteria bacterium]|nr:hypothetical protein [Gammaproteobacteria bacterium]
MEHNKTLEAFRDWELLFEQTNPLPEKPEIDKWKVAGQLSAFVGAVVLSGAQTGASMLDISPLPGLVTELGAGELLATASKIIVVMVAYLTFEITLFVAGLTLQLKDGPIWYWVEFSAAMTVAIVSALHIALPIIPDAFVRTILGLAGPIIVFVAGKSISSLRGEQQRKFTQEVEEYKNLKDRTWKRSKQYKAVMIGVAIPEPAAYQNGRIGPRTNDHMEAILTYMTGKDDWVAIRELRDNVTNGNGELRFKSNQAALPAIKHLQETGKLIREGMSIKLLLDRS